MPCWPQEEDNEALERYQKADSAKQKELAAAVEKLTREVQRRKQELEGEVTLTQGAQIEMDRAAADFRWGRVWGGGGAARL